MASDVRRQRQSDVAVLALGVVVLVVLLPPVLMIGSTGLFYLGVPVGLALVGLGLFVHMDTRFRVVRGMVTGAGVVCIAVTVMFALAR